MELKEDKMQSLTELENQLKEINTQFNNLNLYDRIVNLVPDGTVIYMEDDIDIDPEDYEDFDEEAIPMGEIGAVFTQPNWPRRDWIAVTKVLIKDGSIIAIEVWDCYEEETENVDIHIHYRIDNFYFFEQLLTCIENGWYIKEDKLHTLKFQHY